MSRLPRRGVCRGLVAMPLAGASAAAASTIQPDPIFAAIERHKAALQATEAGQGDDEVGRLVRIETEIRYDMHETVPSTVAGLCAYVSYWAEYLQTDRFLEEEGWEAIPTIAEAMAALFPAKADGGAL